MLVHSFSFNNCGKSLFSLNLLLKEILLDYLERFSLQQPAVSSGHDIFREAFKEVSRISYTVERWGGNESFAKLLTLSI